MKQFRPLIYAFIIMSALLLPLSAGAISEVTPVPTDEAPVEPTPIPPTPIPPTSTPIPPTPIPPPNTPLPTAPSNVTPQPLTPLETEPDVSADDLIDDAISAIQAGNLTRALEIINEAIEVDENNAEAFAIRGIVYVRQERYLLAIDDFTRAIDRMPYSWTFYGLRGDTYALLGEYGEAMLDYNRALYLNPRYETVFRNRSDLYLAQGENDAATVDRLIANGITRWRSDDHLGAIRQFDDAIALNEGVGSDETTALALYNRALSYYNLSDLTSAIQDYDLALELYPGMHDVLLGRGIAHREVGNIVQAGFDFMERITLLERQSFEDTIEVGGFIDVEMAYGNVYRITFEAQAGDIVTINARDLRQVFVDALIVLLDPDGVPIAGDDDFGGMLDAQIDLFALPVTGTYTIVVSHANGGFDGTIRVTLE